MLTFSDAITICLKTKILVWQGRASRSEYWWFQLLNFLILILIHAMFFIPVIGPVIYCIVGFIISWANLMVTIRRLHDNDQRGLLLLAPLSLTAITMIPATMAIMGPNTNGADISATVLALLSLCFYLYILYLLIKRGEEGDNRFGPDPLSPLAQPKRRAFATTMAREESHQEQLYQADLYKAAGYRNTLNSAAPNSAAPNQGATGAPGQARDSSLNKSYSLSGELKARAQRIREQLQAETRAGAAGAAGAADGALSGTNTGYTAPANAMSSSTHLTAQQMPAQPRMTAAQMLAQLNAQEQSSPQAALATTSQQAKLQMWPAQAKRRDYAADDDDNEQDFRPNYEQEYSGNTYPPAHTLRQDTSYESNGVSSHVTTATALQAQQQLMSAAPAPAPASPPISRTSAPATQSVASKQSFAANQSVEANPSAAAALHPAASKSAAPSTQSNTIQQMRQRQLRMQAQLQAQAQQQAQEQAQLQAQLQLQAQAQMQAQAHMQAKIQDQAHRQAQIQAAFTGATANRQQLAQGYYDPNEQTYGANYGSGYESAPEYEAHPQHGAAYTLNSDASAFNTDASAFNAANDDAPIFAADYTPTYQQGYGQEYEPGYAAEPDYDQAASMQQYMAPPQRTAAPLPRSNAVAAQRNAVAAPRSNTIASQRSNTVAAPRGSVTTPQGTAMQQRTAPAGTRSVVSQRRNATQPQRGMTSPQQWGIASSPQRGMVSPPVKGDQRY